ncbi:MAG: FkbM family methyltransferase [archaeon]
MIKKLANKLKQIVFILRLFKNWGLILPTFLGVSSKDKIKCILRNDLIFNTRNNKVDLVVLIECLSSKAYTIYKKIKQEDIIIDIGANIGAFSVYAGSIARKGKIYCFEPEKENFTLLKENIKLNGLSNSKAFNLAVGGKEKIDKIFLSESSSEHSVCLPAKATGKVVAVKFVSLEKIFNDNNLSYCDFMKIDCEGGEYDILFSCPKKILEKIKYIALEFHDFKGSYNHLKLKEYLEKNGFKVILSVQENFYIKPFFKLGMIYAERK